MSSKCLQLVFLPWIISLWPRWHGVEAVTNITYQYTTNTWIPFSFPFLQHQPLGMVMNCMVSGTSNIFNYQHLYFFLIIYLFIKKTFYCTRIQLPQGLMCANLWALGSLASQAALHVGNSGLPLSILNFPLTVYFFGGTTYKARVPHRHHLLNNSKEPPETQ